jgi:tetratricopeptide (TPR) repeat protein
MSPGGTPASAALRALHSASPEIEALRTGPTSPDQERGLILRVANAVDRSLRRILRDDEGADLTLRLQALAPDELRTDAVLAELRRNERLPMELAAGVHELFEARRRLESGASPTDADRTRAVRVTDMLAREINRLGTFSEPAVSRVPPPDDLPEEAYSVSGRRVRRTAPIEGILVGAVLVVVVVFLVLRFLPAGAPSEMEQGLALFGQGQYEEAAQHFWRFSQDNPDDATPHLYLARIHRRTGNVELAAEAIRQAELIAPDDAAVHRELGFLLLDRGQPDVAVERFRHAVELNEASSEGWVGLYRALMEAGRGAEATAVISAAPAEVRALLTPADSI